jgi:ATP-dependent Clp protease ATP-binding subunit ClpA
VSKQAAHKRFSFVPPTFAAPSFERFTMRARNVLAAAKNEAAALRHGYVGTEHLLLGLYSEPEGLAAKTLIEQGIERTAVESRLLEITPRGSANPSDAPPYTPRAIEALAGAVSEAIALGHNYIGTEHLLLALFRDENGLAARLLGELGADREVVRTELIATLVQLAQAKVGPPTSAAPVEPPAESDDE